MRSRQSGLIGIAAALLAFGIRLVRSNHVLTEGMPLLSAFDELYHWRRITFSAANFPAVLEFDPSRGLGGAFVPWPPLYDLAAAAIALLAGATDTYAVLRVIIWIPPVVTSMLIGLTVAVVARHSTLAGALLAVPLACGPFLAVSSSIGDVDHHFLEPFLTFAVMGSTILVARSAGMRTALVSGIALGLALILSLFVQTALIVAAGIAFFCILIVARRPEALVAGLVGFTLCATAVATYRVTRAPGFPGGPWFLGWTHAALLLGAAAALVIVLFLERRRCRRMISGTAGIVIGALVVAATPDAADSVLGGVRFFRGDPWLASIDEFQPVWKTTSSIANYAAALALGGISAIFLVVRRVRTPAGVVMGLFALVYIAASLPNRRFSTISSVLAAVAAATVVATLWREWKGRRGLAVAAAALLVLLPPIQLASWWSGGTVGWPRGTLDFLRVATLLRDRGAPGRVLAPWSFGHLLNVLGERAVVLDNFGTMPDPDTFRAAHMVLLTRDERRVAAFADRHDIRYIVLENPQKGLMLYAQYAGLPEEIFRRGRQPTTYAMSLWYPRAYFGSGPPLRDFRRVATVGSTVVMERVKPAESRY